MKSKVNSYIAIVLIALAGAGAAFLIVRTSEKDSIDRPTGDNEASYGELKQSILTSPLAPENR